LSNNRPDDRTEDCAFGTDDVAPRGLTFKKLRFPMIADTPRLPAMPEIRYRDHVHLIFR
jgi:hypothetical protein